MNEIVETIETTETTPRWSRVKKFFNPTALKVGAIVVVTAVVSALFARGEKCSTDSTYGEDVIDVNSVELTPEPIDS